MTPATVDTVVDMPMDFTVIANNPTEMASAQRSLILWCARKLQAEKLLLKEAQEQLEIAATNKWKTTAWRGRVALSEKRMTFYRKIKLALEAGYYIVPPFPLEVFAIRTDKKTPHGEWKEGRSWGGRHAQKSSLSDAGSGRYVNPNPRLENYSDTKRGYDGKEKEVTYYKPNEFAEVDFPFKLAKSEILTATAKAMALKIFDRMGVLPATQRSYDPIVCGQIVYPVKPTYGEPKAVTFFVAWWLDTKTMG